ncbi:MAG: SsrA-binding protein [Alphaproteobacteria bacterium]|nr:SsrA-binding protein [Alphaproteobacteria bacterium]
MTQVKPNGSELAVNRRARFDYAIEDTYEAGLMLTGSEVKSLRLGKGQIDQSFAGLDRDGDLKVFGLHIEEYSQAGPHLQHEPRRPRKLLLKQKEIKKISAALTRDGMSLVPLKMYFTQRGKVKLLVGLGKGKKLVDKRATEKERDWNREKGREMRNRG